ncbi:hypothetical protein HYQ46_001608 [Verticillium longisporum]|nr:hypothetical protein HYQ46_001608 [Verticillium longisporum]
MQIAVLAVVDDKLLVDPFLNVAVLKPLPCLDASLVGVNIKDPHAAVVAAITGITAEPDAAAVAHPKCWLLVRVVGNGAIISIPETRVEVGCRNALLPLADVLVVAFSVLRQGNMDESKIHVIWLGLIQS